MATVGPAHFFLMATALLVGAAVIVMRQHSAPAIVLAGLTVAAGGYASYALYRAIVPLVSATSGDDAVMVGGRTRVALERDKALTLRSIKELDFDHAMGKVAEGDFVEMRDRLRARAIRLMRQLDGATAYRAQIEQEVQSRLVAVATPMPESPAVAPSTVPPAPAPLPTSPRAAPAAMPSVAPPSESGMPSAALRIACAQCQTSNEPDARFCKVCGTAMPPPVPVCADCGTANESDARFCKMCGRTLNAFA